MINFFRKIRRQLANENKFQKYFKYAFGEILLVVIGILIALQANNWNEQRKQEAQFKATVAQLQNSIQSDRRYNTGVTQFLDGQINQIDSILKNPDDFLPTEIIAKLFMTSLDINNFYISDSKFYAENLHYNPGDSIQNEIAKTSINYVNSMNTKLMFTNDRITPLLIENEIAFPKYKPDNAIIPFDISDTTYYSKMDIESILKTVHSNTFRTILKSVKTEKEILKNILRERNNYVINIQNLLEDYSPYLNKNIGIIGTSIDGFDNEGARSTPMIQTDKDKKFWEIDLYLKNGEVKFRSNNSWNINWGGEHFPKGISAQDGPNIPIPEAGNYHIIFKPVKGEYEFIKQD